MIIHFVIVFIMYVRLYSCLANGSPEEFNKGEALFKNGSVKDALQIGEAPFLRDNQFLGFIVL